MEAEKRIRREIANSNERRRMQSINAGFQSLRTLLPRHEGEKLSKAAILQQTAEYIYALEQEKTRLLSQNCQLKRLLNQHEGGDAPVKRRKTDAVACPISVQSDPEVAEECSRSPESVAIISVVESSGASESELTETRARLDGERRLRAALEERLRTLEARPPYRAVRYEPADELDPSDEIPEMMSVAIVTGDSIGDLDDDCEKIEVRDVEMRMISLEVPPTDERRALGEDAGAPVGVSIKRSRSRSPSPLPRRPSVLETTIDIVEPKVEVEVLPGAEEPSRLYLPNTSRQNLETIVEAIRHLEGDHLFAEEQPLALTNKPERRLIAVGVDEFLRYRQPTRPGVIVGKPS